MFSRKNKNDYREQEDKGQDEMPNYGEICWRNCDHTGNYDCKNGEISEEQRKK